VLLYPGSQVFLKWFCLSGSMPATTSADFLWKRVVPELLERKRVSTAHSVSPARLLAKNRHYTNYGSGHRKVLRKARSNDLTWRLPLHPNERALALMCISCAATPALVTLSFRRWRKEMRAELPTWRNGTGLAAMFIVSALWLLHRSPGMGPNISNAQCGAGGK